MKGTSGRSSSTKSSSSKVGEPCLTEACAASPIAGIPGTGRPFRHRRVPPARGRAVADVVSGGGPTSSGRAVVSGCWALCWALAPGKPSEDKNEPNPGSGAGSGDRCDVSTAGASGSARYQHLRLLTVSLRTRQCAPGPGGWVGAVRQSSAAKAAQFVLSIMAVAKRPTKTVGPCAATRFDIEPPRRELQIFNPRYLHPPSHGCLAAISCNFGKPRSACLN
jgi:hypothetical protein